MDFSSYCCAVLSTIGYYEGKELGAGDRLGYIMAILVVEEMSYNQLTYF